MEGGLSCESESWGCATSPTCGNGEHEEEEEGRYPKLRRSKSMATGKKNKKKKKNQVLLEGYMDQDLARTKSLTDEDLDELKGCLDLGFGFSYDEIPELCNTLPALELCYSMSHKFFDHSSSDSSSSPSSPPPPHSLSPSIANWRISSPGQFLIYFFIYL